MPPAVTVKVAVLPTVTVWLEGWLAMVGALGVVWVLTMSVADDEVMLLPLPLLMVTLYRFPLYVESTGGVV